jgi:hypothetical protein
MWYTVLHIHGRRRRQQQQQQQLLLRAAHETVLHSCWYVRIRLHILLRTGTRCKETTGNE